MRRILLLFSLFSFALTPLNAEVVRSIIKKDKTFTRDDFVLAQCTFQEKSLIGREDAEESVLNLKKTDLFGAVSIEVVKIDSGMEKIISVDSLSRFCDLDTVDVYLTTKEMLALLPSMGASFASPYFVTLGVYFGNLWRIRHKIEASVTFLQVKEFALEYTVPSVYSRKYNGIAYAAVNQKSRPLLSIEEQHKTGSVGLGYSFDPKLIPLLTAGYDRVSFKDDTFSFSFENNDRLGYDEFAFFEGKLTTDHRNDPYFPRKGFYSETSLKKSVNWWRTPINALLFTGDYRVFIPSPGGVIAMRNRIVLTKGTLSYYMNNEPAAFENRAINDTDMVAFNRYTGNLEYRYQIPYRYVLEYPVIGTISINFMAVMFADWSVKNSNIESFAVFDFASYMYGFGGGLLVYSELFNSIGLYAGYNPKSTETQLLKKIKYNLVLMTWNF